VLRLYDTATREVRELALREPGTVSIYLCGPTVYGPPHLGHGRATLVYDILRRYLRWSGLEVRLVSNVTDIEDKIIERAQREGRPWQDITSRCERVWFDAMAGINVARPDDTPHATDYVDEMVEMIGALVAGGNAYVTDDGVYMSVESVPDYGLLAQQSLDEMRAGGGEREVVGADIKHHPADFVLWKLSKPDEPSWPSPWGDGRPGWHSECVVMSLDLLGEGFDLHCGGQDLRFPHHENERAQAVALGKEFARHWMHNGFVVDAEGEKMSKSLGNFFTIREVLADWPGEVIRYAMLSTHYRQPINWTEAGLREAKRTLDHWYQLTAEVAPGMLCADTSDALGDDLNTPKAFAALHELRAEAVKGEKGAAACLKASAQVLGLLQQTAGEWSAWRPSSLAIDEARIETLIDARNAARKARNFKEADRIRDELGATGVELEDRKDGTTGWKVKR
jgi:cysteinyl-tRNA synthetase